MKNMEKKVGCREREIVYRELLGKPYIVKAREAELICRDVYGKRYNKQAWVFEKEGKYYVLCD